MTVPHVLTVPLIVANTDLVTLIAEQVARRYASELNLMLFEPPVSLPEFTTDVLTSAARSTDPALAWLREQVVHVGRSKF
jgi:DNA-binding transcriptional LysR family regulator